MSEHDQTGRTEAESNAPAAPGVDVILASNSPRRKQLLEDAGVKFTVYAPEVDENLDEAGLADPETGASQLAERKAGAVVQQILGFPEYRGTTAVIGADTMVVLDGRIFGKPRSLSDAKGMLRKLSGRTHQVITGVSVWVVDAPLPGKVSLGHRTFAEVSDVTFKQLTDEQIADYLRLGESFDKAGAYAIQSEGAKLIEGYRGDYENIVGLPVTHLLREFPDLKRASDV